MSNYPDGMTASDWRHVEGPDTEEEDGTCPEGHRTMAFTAMYLHGRKRWLVCGTCDWSTDPEPLERDDEDERYDRMREER